MEQAEGIAIAVGQVRCRYRAPARYDDEILVRTALERLKPKTLDFVYEIRNFESGAVLAEGSTTHVAVDTEGRPRALPEPYFTLLSAWVSA
jgi:acyl-CoA thioester hydrolase